MSKRGIAKGGKAVYGAPLGVLMLEARFPRIFGDMGNAATWPFPVLYRVVSGASPEKVVLKGAAGLLPDFVAWPFEDYPARLFDPSALLSFGVISNKTNKWGNTNVDFSNAAITVRQRGGATLTVSRVSYDTLGYGLPNNIQFAVSGLQPNIVYDVTIDRVAVSGVQRSYSYFFRIVP